MYYDFNNTVRLSDDSSLNDSRVNESSAGIYRPKRKRTLADYEFILNENSKFQTSELGKGAYGVVKKVKDKHTGKVYAMKIMSKKAIFEYSNKENLKREINIQKGILHPHIVRLYAYFEDTDNVYLILEYAENGSLFHYVRKKKKFLENEAFVYFFQTCLGIDYLHKRDIIHRDLKPENLLLDSEGNIKICDFGWSADINTKRHTFCGTVDYMAPEMVKNQPHDHRLDIWCLGVLLYEMLHGHAPFKGRSDQEKTNNISMNIPINFDHSLSQEVVDLIRRILQPAPVNRISMQGIFEHPWMKKAEKIYQIDVMSYVRHQDEQIREIKRADFNKSMTLNQSYSNTDVTDRSETGIQQPNPTTRNYGSSDRLPIAHKYSNSSSSLNTSNNSYGNYNNNNAKIIRIQDHSTPLTLAQKISYEEPKKLSSYSRSTKASESSSIGSGNGSNTLTIEQLLRDHGARPQEKPQDILMPRRINTESSKSQQFTSSYITGLMKQSSVSYPHRTEEDQREAQYTGKYNFDRYEVRRDTADGHTNTVYPSAQKQKSMQYEGSYFRDVNMHTSERRERQPQPQPQYQQQYHQLPSYRDKRVEARTNTPDKLSRSDVGNRSNYEKLYTRSGPLIREEKEELEDFQRVSRVSARNVEIFKLQRPSTKVQKDTGLFEKLLVGIGCISREAGNQIGKRNGK